MLCPVCQTVELRMSERQGVEIDYCPQCRGVWLDRGELDKIIERSAIVEQSYRQQDRHDDDYDNDGYGKQKYPQQKKKRGFLEEMFDSFD
jgi:uncharacterized protein